MSTELMRIEDVAVMATAVAKSHLFPGIETQEQAMALMLVCQADGIHPMVAMRRYHIIKGRPAWKSQALAAEFQRLGGKLFYRQRDSKACIVDGEFKGEKYSVEWNIEMARAAGLTDKDVWKAYARQMLSARATAEVINVLCPGISAGIYTEEEVMDMPDSEPPKKGKTDVNEERVLEINTLLDAADTQEKVDFVIRNSHKIVIESMPKRYRTRIEEHYFEKIAEFAGPTKTETKAAVAVSVEIPAAQPSEPTPDIKTLVKRLEEDSAKYDEIAEKTRSAKPSLPAEPETPPESPAPLHRRPLAETSAPVPPSEHPPAAEPPKEAPKTYGPEANYPEWIKKGVKCDYALHPGGNPIIRDCTINSDVYAEKGQLVVMLDKMMSPVPISCLVEIKAAS